MTADILAGAAGLLLSLVFSYIPGLNTWYAALAKEIKQLIMFGLIVLVAGVSYGLACWGVLAELTGIGLTCDRAGALGLLRAVVIALVVNQGVFEITPQMRSVRLAKYAKFDDGSSEM